MATSGNRSRPTKPSTSAAMAGGTRDRVMAGVTLPLAEARVVSALLHLGAQPSSRTKGRQLPAVWTDCQHEIAPRSSSTTSKGDFHVESVSTGEPRCVAVMIASVVFVTTALAQMPTSPWKKGAPFPEPDEELYGVAVERQTLRDWRLGRRQGSRRQLRVRPGDRQVDEEAARCRGRRTMRRLPR